MIETKEVDLNDVQEQVSEETLSLAKLLSAHPQAKAALLRSIERQQESRDQQTAPSLDCPYCGAAGIQYLTLPSKDGPKAFYRRPADCCDYARRDAAEKALHYALFPNGDSEERLENADLYAALKASITTPALLRELDTHELLLADVERRIIKPRTSQSGKGGGV